MLAAGDEVCEEVAARAGQGEVEYAELVGGMLTPVRSWLRDRRRDSRLTLLGRLLWSAERGPTRSFDTDRETVWRHVPAPIQAAPRWMVPPLLAGVGILVHASAGPPRDLRASGVPTTAGEGRPGARETG